MPPPAPAQVAQTENKICIEPIFYPYGVRQRIFHRVKQFLMLKPVYLPVQGVPFYLYVKITNTGNETFSGAMIHNASIKSARGLDFFNSIDKRPEIPRINPDEKEEVLIDTLYTNMDAQAWLNFEIVPALPNTRVILHYIGIDGKIEEMSNANNIWARTFVIRSRAEVEQSRTNNLILFLTALLFIDAVWGIREALSAPLIFLKVCLEGIVKLLSYLISFIHLTH